MCDMALEIERKFLLLGQEFKQEAYDRVEIRQGYLSLSPERTVRVRTRGDKGFLTIKGRSSDDGLSREEWEREIPLAEAEELLAGCRAVVEKTRYLVRVGRHTFEVDEFHGSNEGLLLAEVELTSPDEVFERPAWLGREVTGEKAYYNSQIALRTLKKEVER